MSDLDFGEGAEGGVAQTSQEIEVMKRLTQAPAPQQWKDGEFDIVVAEDEGVEVTRETSIFCGKGHIAYFESPPIPPEKIVFLDTHGGNEPV